MVIALLALAGRSAKLLAGGRRDVAGIPVIASVFRPRALDGHHFADLQRVLVPTPSAQSPGSAHFQGPIGDVAFFILNVDIKIDVRIAPVHLRDGTGELDRFLLVVFCGERMVRLGRRTNRHDGQNG